MLGGLAAGVARLGYAPRVLGQELNPQLAQIAAATLFLHGHEADVRVADSLTEDGRVFFADDAYRAPDELIEGPSSATIRRRLDDGTAFRIVKVPHRPRELEQRLRQLGWHITVTPTSGPFYWGAGTRICG